MICPAPAGLTFGRYAPSDGRQRFVRQARPTLGEPNAGPLVGPVVLNELMYNPPPQGTNPNDPASYLRVESVQPGGGSTRLWFHAVAGRTYTVLCRDDLLGAPWMKLKDVPAPTVSGEMQVLDETARAARFYRLATPRQ